MANERRVSPKFLRLAEHEVPILGSSGDRVLWMESMEQDTVHCSKHSYIVTTAFTRGVRKFGCLGVRLATADWLEDIKELAER